MMTRSSILLLNVAGSCVQAINMNSAFGEGIGNNQSEALNEPVRSAMKSIRADMKNESWITVDQQIFYAEHKLRVSSDPHSVYTRALKLFQHELEEIREMFHNFRFQIQKQQLHTVDEQIAFFRRPFFEDEKREQARQEFVIYLDEIKKRMTAIHRCMDEQKLYTLDQKLSYVDGKLKVACELKQLQCLSLDHLRKELQKQKEFVKNINDEMNEKELKTIDQKIEYVSEKLDQNMSVNLSRMSYQQLKSELEHIRDLMVAILMKMRKGNVMNMDEKFRFIYKALSGDLKKIERLAYEEVHKHLVEISMCMPKIYAAFRKNHLDSIHDRILHVNQALHADNQSLSDLSTPQHDAYVEVKNELLAKQSADVAADKNCVDMTPKVVAAVLVDPQDQHSVEVQSSVGAGRVGADEQNLNSTVPKKEQTCQASCTIS